MNPINVIGVVLIVAGGLGLAYGGFSYTKESTGLKLGALELKVQEKKSVDIPMVLSIGGIVFGIFMLVVGRK
jgi:hypothetical protein